MRTQLRKIWRDVWSRKARTALVSVSIFIGVFGTVTLFSMGDLLVKQLEEDLDADKLAMIRSYVTAKQGVTIDNEAALQAVRDVDPTVSAVEGQAVYPIQWKTPGADEFETSFVFAYSEPFDAIQIEPMRKLEGDYPQAGEGRHELAIERRFADKYDLEVGDELVVRILSSAQEENGVVAEETWTVVGIVFYPYGYQGGFNPVLAEDSVFATYEDAQYISAFAGFSSIYVRFENYAAAEVHYEAVIDTIDTETAYFPVFSRAEDPAQNSLIEFAKTTGGVLSFLALLALVVSGFLVFNVISNIVNEQKRQIGVMKSLGADWVDNYLIYSGMALVYGIIGVIPGVLLGVPMGFSAAQGLAAQSNALIDKFDYSPRAIVLGIVMGLAIPVFASLLPVFNGTRVRILDAITDLGIDAHYGHGPLARLLGKLPIPINMRQGISNVIQKKWRMAFTVLTLTVAAGAFMGVFAVFASINTVVDDFFDTFNFQFVVVPNLAGTGRSNEEIQTLIMNNVDGLSTKGPYAGIAIEIDGYVKVYDPNTGPPALFANGYDPESDAYLLELASGSSLEENPEGVILNRSIAEAIDKQVGDIITIRAGGRNGEFPIVGIATYPYDGVWFHWRTLAQLAGFVDENGEPAPRGMLFNTDKADATADDVDNDIQKINDLLLENGLTANYQNIEFFTETLSEQISFFQLIFNLTAGLIALVGAVGLLTTLSMSVFERQKEIGVMRSVGAGSFTIVSQFLTEGLAVGLLAWLIGVPLSYFLSTGLISALNLGDEYRLSYPPIAIVVGLVGTLLVTTIASIWPSIAAARRTVSDILRYQ